MNACACDFTDTINSNGRDDAEHCGNLVEKLVVRIKTDMMVVFKDVYRKIHIIV